MARHNAAELATGAVVLAVAGSFLIFAVTNTGKSFDDGGYKLHASFDHVDGLALGADVRVAGVKVGSVEAIRLDPKNFVANVTFSVQDGVGLSTDSSATVATDGLLGGKYLDVEPGGEEKMLAPGGEVTITQGSVNLESLLGKYIFGSTGKGGDAKGAGSKGGDTKSDDTKGAGSIAPLK